MVQTTTQTTEHGEVPETDVEVQRPLHACDAELLRFMDDALHAMSQPITVLLCTLEYSVGLNSVEEIRPMLLTGQQAVERLRETALGLRVRLQAAMKQA